VLALVFAVLARSGSIEVVAQEVPELQITSTYYIVLDADTGEIFAQRGAHERAAPASLTKVFTAIEAIESAPGNVPITTAEADLVTLDATQVGFGPGETFLVEDLIYGMLLPSGNDAARALARALGEQQGGTGDGGEAVFLTRMNERVEAMGLTNTYFRNPDGWGVPGHYSSAYDIAVFTMYALKYPRFVQAISTAEYRTSNGEYAFDNTNRMLKTYDGIIGGKTGYDDDAGYCLVEVASRGGSTMISVTLDGVAPDDWYDDNRVLLNYAFEQKALRQEQGLGIVGEVARFRDPDAKAILAMASAGGSVGPRLPDASRAAPEVARSERPGEAPVALADHARAGVGTAGLLVATAIASALILMQGAATWRLPAARPRLGLAAPASFDAADTPD
jgi:D-alanyl-D-alanine carboxypeptidase (penicillin-binding protein 5/6)